MTVSPIAAGRRSQLLAEKTKESPEVVAKHAAQRNFDRAKAGEFLQVEGKWHKKEG